MISSRRVKNFEAGRTARPAVAPYLRLLSLQRVFFVRAICLSLFVFHQFAPSSFAKRKRDRSPWLAWAPFSVFPQFPCRRPPLFPRSLPSALRDTHPCIF